MKRWQKVIDSTYAKVFSDSNQKRIEFATLWLSLIGFVIHLVLIYAKKFNWFNIPFEANLLIDPISPSIKTSCNRTFDSCPYFMIFSHGLVSPLIVNFLFL